MFRLLESVKPYFFGNPLSSNIPSKRAPLRYLFAGIRQNDHNRPALEFLFAGYPEGCGHGRPAGNPGKNSFLLESLRACSMASSLVICSTRSTRERSRVSGMNPAPMPWIL